MSDIHYFIGFLVRLCFNFGLDMRIRKIWFKILFNLNLRDAGGWRLRRWIRCWNIDRRLGILVWIIESIICRKGKVGFSFGHGIRGIYRIVWNRWIGHSEVRTGRQRTGTRSRTRARCTATGKGRTRANLISDLRLFTKIKFLSEVFNLRKLSSVRTLRYGKFSEEKFKNFQNFIRNQPFVSYKFFLQAYGNTLRECWLLCTYLPQPLNIKFISKTNSLFVNFEEFWWNQS